MIRFRALALSLVVGLVVGVTAFAAEKPALVALVQNKIDNADERSLLDRLMATMIRNATHDRYGESAILVDELADPNALYRSIVQLARAGRTVDVMIVAAGAPDRLELGGTEVDAESLMAGLSELRGARGRLRVVYTTAGSQLADAWRALGARTVLSHAGDGELPPFFFPNFIKHWGDGDSVSRAAAKAGAFSTSLVSSFSSFVTQETLIANNGVLDRAPVLAGADLDVTGREEAQPWSLSPVQWPEPRPSRPSFNHTNLEDGVLQILARALSNQIELRPELMPDMTTLVDKFGDPVFTTIQGLFPGRNANEIAVGGGEVRVILGKIIPDLDHYMQQLVDQLDTILVTRENGKMLVDVWLTPEQVRFPLHDEKSAKTGQPYAVDLDRHVHFEISMLRDSITLGGIKGFTAMLKLPVVPDGVHPLSVKLDTAKETLTINAAAVKDLIKVVGKADVRARKFTGVDWLATMFKNGPLLLGLLLFWVGG